MPDLPQHLPLPSLQASSVTDVNRWGNSTTQSLIRVWTGMIQALNALSRTGTAATMPTTPPMNTGFFTNTDANQTYIAVNGVWKSLGEQRDGRRYTLLIG